MQRFLNRDYPVKIDGATVYIRPMTWGEAQEQTVLTDAEDKKQFEAFISRLHLFIIKVEIGDQTFSASDDIKAIVSEFSLGDINTITAKLAEVSGHTKAEEKN